MLGAFAFCLLLAATPAFAQFGPTTAPLSVTLTPQYPQPYEPALVTVDSTVLDLSSTVVTIAVNGTVIARDSGVQSIPITVGGPGTVTRVSVTAVDGSGQQYQQDLVIHPASVALVVEPLTTTHPFYDGGALVAPEGRVRLIAIPDVRTSPTTAVASADLVYNWSFGDQQLQSSSGIGRSILNAVAPERYRDAQVDVIVSTRDSAVVAEGTVNISPVDPLMRIYAYDPLLGPLFDTALSDTFTMSGKESTFRVVPYFFTARPGLTWNVNGSAGGSDQDLTVRSTGSGAGTAVINVSGNDPSNSAESANASFSVSFGQKSSGIFGL